MLSEFCQGDFEGTYTVRKVSVRRLRGQSISALIWIVPAAVVKWLRTLTQNTIHDSRFMRLMANLKLYADAGH
jgi:hypothetical protein